MIIKAKTKVFNIFAISLQDSMYLKAQDTLVATQKVLDVAVILLDRGNRISKGILWAYMSFSKLSKEGIIFYKGVLWSLSHFPGNIQQLEKNIYNPKGRSFWESLCSGKNILHWLNIWYFTLFSLQIQQS